MLLDLNARRAARAARQRATTVTAGERTYDLVPQVPLRVLELVADNDFPGAAKMLLVNPGEDWESFASEMDMEDLTDIISAYGNSLGESSASTDSSTNTGEPSGQTSDASITSISPSAATETPA